MPIDDQDCPELTCCDSQNPFVGECCQPKPFDYSSQQYCNTEQTATASCPEGLCGDIVTVTVPPNAFCSLVSQADADAQALAAAQTQAEEELECVECDDGGGGECETIVYDSITPTIESDAVTYFNSGFHWPAGNYRVEYIEGALRYNPSFNWGLNDSTAHCFRVIYSNGTESIMGPALDFQRFSTQELLEAHNAGQGVEFAHTGGRIGVFLDDFPYADNVAGDPTPTFRLSKICGEVQSCAEGEAIIEQVMRAVQERQNIITGTFIDWPDSTVSGDPGNYPPDGFYDSDIASNPDPDARRAELIQSIANNITDSWLNGDANYKYLIDDLEGFPSLDFLSESELPILTVTSENYAESLETLRGYCCQMQYIYAKGTFFVDQSRKVGSGADPVCDTAVSQCELNYSLSTWTGFSDVNGIVESANFNTPNFERQLQRIRWSINFDLTRLTTGVPAMFLRLTPYNGNLLHDSQAPQSVDSLFHRTEGNPDLGISGWESPVVNNSDAGLSCQIPCSTASADGGWLMAGDGSEYVVQVFKSNNPEFAHWTYYP